jgi:hypothetical protein
MDYSKPPLLERLIPGLALTLLALIGGGLIALSQMKGTIVMGAAGARAAAPVLSAAPVPQLGMPIVAGNWQYTVLESRRTKTMDAGFMTATAKGEYIAVVVEVVNRGKENFGLHAWDFELLDGTGVKYRPDQSSTWAWSQALPGRRLGAIGLDSAQMPPGVSGTYVVVFDVAPDAQGLQLRLVQAGKHVPL